jgi:hypothetical protein
MIANFFRSLREQGVESLLISGQATVLYGAAAFSEDIDLWINPTAENCACFLAALRACQARYYKLTPPFEVAYLLRGHGFHFTLPGETGGFLDVMGQPPRAGSFGTARGAAKWMDTDWGRVLTIGIKELVELKKTQRLDDYPIISRLALAWFEHLDRAATATAADYRWALENVFTLSELRRLFEAHPAAVAALPVATPAALSEFARRVQDQGGAPEQIETEVSGWMQQHMERLQQADRGYWRGIIAELRRLRATGQLVPEGALV